LRQWIKRRERVLERDCHWVGKTLPVARAATIARLERRRRIDRQQINGRTYIIDLLHADRVWIDECQQVLMCRITDRDIITGIRAGVYRSRAGTLARGIVHLGVHKQNVPQLDNPNNQQQ